MRVHLAVLFILALSFRIGVAQTSSTLPIDGIRNVGIPLVLIENGTVVVDSTKTIQNGKILIREGKIVDVGEGIEAPPGTKRIDLRGKTIYPGGIEPYVEVETPNPENGKGAPHWNANVVPQRDVSLTYRPNGEQLTRLRKAGMSAFVAVPSGGIVRGSSSIFSTNATTADQSLLASKVAGHLRLTVGFRSNSYPTSPMGAVALARQSFLDADWYQKAWQAYRAQPSLPQPENNVALQAIVDLKEAGRPVVIDAMNEQFALRADLFAREFGLPMILHGSGREYRLLEQIAKSNRALIIPLRFPKAPDVNSPEAAVGVTLQELIHWELAPENPSRLVRQGCKIAFTTEGLEDPSEWVASVRTAIARGLDRKAALEAFTSNPAEMFGVSHLMGSIAIGKWANFIVADGDLFEEKTKIEETWVQGERHRWNEETPIDIAGEWKVELVGPEKKPTSLVLKIGGDRKLSGSLALPAQVLPEGEDQSREEPPSPSDRNQSSENSKEEAKTVTQAEEKKAKDGVVPLEKMNRSDLRVSALFDDRLSSKSPSGKGQLSLVILHSKDVLASLQLKGSILWPDGSSSHLVANRTAPTSNDKKGPSKDSKQEEAAVLSKVTYPLGENGRNGLPEQLEWIHIRNATLWTCGPDGTLLDSDLLIHQGYIAAVGKGLETPKGAMVIDASGKHVSPGIIDCHSHMATDGGVNEVGQSVTAEVRIGDFIDASDYNIYCQLAGGVTAANILHGSANPIGGQNQVIKLRWGGTSEELKMKEAPAGIKFALGENVKQSNRNDVIERYPQSRMGVEQIMRDRFEAAKEYQKNWNGWSKQARGLPPRRDLELEAISEILKGERWIHCHSYRQDEILAMLRTLEDYGITIGTLQHILEGYKVAEAMAKHGAMASSFSDWWGYKFEVVDAIPFNGALMHRMGIVVSFNSDDSELGRHLNHEAAKAVKYGGISEVEAFRFVTLNPAKQLRIDGYVGSLEVGKQADFVLWNGSPLSAMTRCEETWIDGRKFFDRREDERNRKEISELHTKLVQKVIRSGAPVASPREKEIDPTTLWPRFDEYCRSR